ncbi:MAG: RraA family protein [Pseudomonadota bacterium]
MIEDPPKLVVNRAVTRPTAEQIAAFQGVPTGFVADAMDGTGALDPQIKPLQGRGLPVSVAGPALTADPGPADVLATFAALSFVQPGDVLVCAFQGHQGCAAAGDRTMGMLRNNGGIAFVTDGPVRDYEGLMAAGLPIWCTGLNPASPFTSGPGKVGFPVTIGGRMVASGDMVIADRDGVVTVPFSELDSVIERLKHVAALEAALDAEVAAGRKQVDAVAALLESAATRYVD